MNAGEDGAQLDRQGLQEETATLSRKLVLFTRLHLAGSPFGRNAFIIHILGLFITKRHTHAKKKKKEELLLTMNHTPIWQIIWKECDLKTAGVTGSNILAAIDMMK